VILYLKIKRTNTAHFSEVIYKALIKEYQEKIKKLKQEKQLS
jgi:hypothetical protein